MNESRILTKAVATTARPLVIYHENCFDGFTAAWVARRLFGDNADYLPVSYGDAMPDVAGRTVYIIDFSWPREVLIEAEKRSNRMVVLDHHKTAQAALEGLPFCTFDMNRSGCQLAWDHFFPNTPRDKIVDYAGDRDLWLFKLPYSREVNAYMHTCEYDFEVWSDAAAVINHDFECVVDAGCTLLRYQKRLVNQMCAQAKMLDIAGRRVPAVNASVLFSEIGEQLCLLYPDAPFAAYWFHRGDGMTQWGLRSKGGFDVSEVAKLYGGGGHAAAAGWIEDTTIPSHPI
jgi:uncharacterized protein